MPSGNNYLLISVPVDTSVDSDNRGYKEAVDDCRQEVLLALRQKLTVAQALSEVDEIQVPEFKVAFAIQFRLEQWISWSWQQTSWVRWK